jgi:serine/threonine protein kinase
MLFSSQRDDEEREQSSQMITMMIASTGSSSVPHSLTGSPVRKKRNKAGASLLFSASQEVSLIDHHPRERREEREHSNATTLASGSCPPSLLFPTDGEILGIGHPDDLSLPPSQQFYHQQLHFGDASSQGNSYDFISSSLSTSFRDRVVAGCGGNNRHLMLGLSQEEYGSQSQSSFNISQFSQDFADRLSSMQMKCASSVSNTQDSQCHSQQGTNDPSFPFPCASQSSDLSMIGGVRLENAFSSGLPSTVKKGRSNRVSNTASVSSSTTHRKNSKNSPSPASTGRMRSRSNSLRGEKEREENVCPNSQTIPRSTIKAINAANGRKDLRSSKGSKGHHQQSQLMIEPEKQIDLPSVNRNPFLVIDSSSPLEYYYHQFLSSSTGAAPFSSSIPMSSKKRSSSTASSGAFVPRKLWIGAYKERPRYYTDYEEVMLLGEGTFSSVTAVRHVIDGCLYAIKKCNEKISSSSHQALLLKEVHALSYLSSASSSSSAAVVVSCPNLIRYYSSWIHDSHLYIQLELCSLGSLEDLIVSNPSKTSIMRALLASSSLSGSPSLPFLPNPSFSSSLTHPGSSVSSSFNRSRSDSFPLSLPSDGCCFLGSQNNNTNPSQQHLSSHIEGVVMKGIEEDCGWKILEEICKALVFMHERQLVHLDIRPANIFLTLSSSVSVNSAAVSSLSSSTASAVKMGCSSNSVAVHALERGNSFRSLPSASLSSASHHKQSPSLFSTVIKGGSFSCSNSSSSNEQLLSRSSSLNGAQPACTVVNKKEAYLSARKKVESSLVNGEYELRLGDLGHTRHAIKDKERDIEEGQTRYCPRELIDFSLAKVDLMKCDIFSLGASLYELCLGRFLGEGGGGGGVDEWHNIRDGILDEENLSSNKEGNVSYSKEWKELLRRMMFPIPAERPTAKDLLEKAEKYFERKRNGNPDIFASPVSSSVPATVLVSASDAMDLSFSQQPTVSGDLQEEIQRLKALLLKNHISF